MFERMVAADVVYMDGTFKICPRPYMQYFTIHIFVGNRYFIMNTTLKSLILLLPRCFPCLHILCTHKNELTYNSIFEWIKETAINRELNIHWQRTMSDFESGLLPSIQHEFPGVAVHGCHFHFCKAIYDRMVHLGLKRNYELNENFQKFVRMVFSLTFLPIHDVDHGVQSLLIEYIPENIPDMMDTISFQNFMNYLVGGMPWNYGTFMT